MPTNNTLAEVVSEAPQGQFVSYPASPFGLFQPYPMERFHVEI